MDFTPMKLFADRSLNLMTGTRLFSTKSGTVTQMKTSIITPQKTVHSNFVPNYSSVSPNKKFTNPNYNINLISPKLLFINTMKQDSKILVPEDSGGLALNPQTDIITQKTDQVKPHTEVRNKNSPRRNKRVIKQNKINSKNHSVARDSKSHNKQNILRDIDSDRFTMENNTITEGVKFGEMYEINSPNGTQDTPTTDSLDRLHDAESLEVPSIEENSKKNNFTYPISATKSKKRRPLSPNNAFYRNVIEQISLERKTNRPESINNIAQISTDAPQEDNSEIYTIIPIKNSTLSYEIQFSEAKRLKPELYSQKPNTIERKFFYDSCANFGTIFHKTVDCKPTLDCDIDDFIEFEHHDESDENVSFNSESSIESEMSVGCRRTSSECDSEEDIVIEYPITRPVNRPRQTSECDSEDSFVVFDRGDCDQVDGYDDDEDMSDSESEDEDEEEHDESRYVPACSSTPNKKVHFKEDPELCTVHRMVKWNYAYRKARKGLWEQQARDSERFRHRINTMDTIIGAVLEPEHRRRVYNERFS